jgi:hypothetical protein
MKYFSNVEGYEDCFVDVVDKWTMKELRELTASNETDYFSLFKRKVTSILIKDIDGNELRDITKLDDSFIENIDVVMAGFLGTVLAMHVRERRSLGGLSVRQSSTISEQQTTKKN